MKSRKIWFISGIAAGVLATLAVRYVISAIQTENRPLQGVMVGMVIYKWLNAWAGDHQGELPANLEQLKSADYGVDAEYLEWVTAYPGAGRNLNSLGKDFVILRCRARALDAMEARVFASGSSQAFTRE